MTYRFIPLQPNLPILEAERYITIRVTIEDIEAGVRDDPRHCALALAAAREFGRTLKQVQVMTTVAYFEFRDRVERFECNARTRDMIRRFDQTGEFEPGDYTFKPVRPSETRSGKKSKNIRHGRHLNGTHPTAGRRQEQTVIIRPRGQNLRDAERAAAKTKKVGAR